MTDSPASNLKVSLDDQTPNKHIFTPVRGPLMNLVAVFRKLSVAVREEKHHAQENRNILSVLFRFVITMTMN